jgi:hypothetical protein
MRALWPSDSRWRTYSKRSGRVVETLTISSDLGEPVPLTTKVHFLTAVRADADRVEIQHDSVASEVTLPVVETQG